MPQIPNTQGPQDVTPDPACSRHRQQHQILDLFTSDCHVALEESFGRLPEHHLAPTMHPIRAWARPDASRKSYCLLDAGVHSSLTEIVTLGRTLKRRSWGRRPTSIIPTPAMAYRAINGASDTYAAPGLPKPHQHHSTQAFPRKQSGFKPPTSPQYEEPSRRNNVNWSRRLDGLFESKL